MSWSAGLMTALPIVIVAAWMATRGEGPWTATRVLGLLLILLGLAFLTLARIQLEKRSSRREGLVTGGLYSHIRHPIYLFSFVAFAGVLLYLDKPLGLPLLLLLGLFPIYLGRREEQDLETLYGDQYRRYKQRTWF